MWQLIAVAAAFICLPIMVQKFKLSYGAAIPVTGLLICLLTLTSPASILKAAVNVFITFTSIHIIICVTLISVLGNLLKHYGFLKQIVDILKRLLNSRKLLICIIPSILGLLSVPGGAYLSAPFVDELGKEMHIGPSKRVAINLAYRHALVIVYPLSTMLLYLSAVLAGEVSIYSVIALNAGFVVVMLFASYFLFLQRGKDSKPLPHEEKQASSLSADLKALAFYTMPIYFVVLVSMIPGVPVAVAISLSILLTCLLCDRKNLLKVLPKGININLAITVAGLFFIQNIIATLTQVNDIFLRMFADSSVIETLFAIAVGCFSAGMLTCLAFVPISIFVPIILELPVSNTETLIYVFFAWTWSFMGYYFSMGHLCQILSLQCIYDAKLTDVYKEHLKLFSCLAVASFALFYIYRLILVH